MLTPQNIPNHFFPLPEGHVLLGQGGFIPNGQIVTAYAINLVSQGDGDFNEWSQADDFRIQDDDGLCYAVPFDHPLVEQNRELVALLNPDIAFPWTATVFRPIDPNCRAMQRMAEYPNHWIIGNTDEVVWPDMMSFEGVRYANYEGGYIRLTRPERGDSGVIIAPHNHPLVRANMEAVRFHNPGAVIEEAPVSTWTPARPLPDNLPPVPEGYVLIGWGERRYSEIRSEERGFFLRGLRGENIDERVYWEGPGYWGISDDGYCFAYPEHGEFAQAFPEVVAYYRNLASLRTAATIPPFPPLPENITPPPDGYVILGLGDTLYNTAEEGYIWSIGEWSGSWPMHFPDDRNWFAYRADGDMAAAFPERVAFYNQPSQPVVQSVTTPVALPAGVPPLPDGVVYLGVGGSFRRERNFPGWYFNPLEHRGWMEARSLGGHRPDIHLAVREDSEILRLNPQIGAAAPAVPVAQALALEPWMPPLPEGYVYLGRGRTFTRLPDRNFNGISIRRASSTWSAETNWSGTSEDLYYAVREGAEILDLNPHLKPSRPEPVAVTQDPMVFGKRQWLLTLNGTPVSSLSELENLCSHLISKPENLTPLTTELWKALEYDDPESRIEKWATREPLLLMVDFVPDKNEADILIPTIAESSKSIGEIITTAAAGVLLRGGLSNHFNYTEEGRLIINPANPPDLEQGCEILRRTLEVRETGQKLDNYSAWTLGMLGDELERFFGDAFDPSLVMEATGRCYNTYITSLKVYRELWANRRNLSFTHHKEALYAKVPMEDTTFILDTADRLKLSVAQQRKLVTFVRLYGRAAFDEDPPQDAELLMERLEVKSVNKNFLFFLRSENKWFKYRGPFEHIPNGASPIINADTRVILDTTGQPTEMAEWTPIGIEVPYVRGHGAVLEAERVAEAEAETPGIGTLTIAELDRLYAELNAEAGAVEPPLVDARAPEILDTLASTQEGLPADRVARETEIESLLEAIE